MKIYITSIIPVPQTIENLLQLKMAFQAVMCHSASELVSRLEGQCLCHLKSWYVVLLR